jgi:hypothetical protein
MRLHVIRVCPNGHKMSAGYRQARAAWTATHIETGEQAELAEVLLNGKLVTVKRDAERWYTLTQEQAAKWME